jgi:hypothetical protein
MALGRFIVLLIASITKLASAQGHRMIADITEDQLRSSGQYGDVQAVLGTLPLADISTCPDEIRQYEREHLQTGYEMSSACSQVFSNPPKRTASWHFVNIPASLNDPTNDQIRKACENDCLVSKIEYYGTVYANRQEERRTRLQALSFIVHFISDVYQPLHTANRGVDGGGYAEHVEIEGIETTLHHAWDDTLITDMGSDSFGVGAALLRPEIAAAAAEPVKTPIDWARESFALAKGIAYKRADGTDIPDAEGDAVIATLDEDYKKLAHPVVRQQLARAGVRVASFISTR